MNLGPARCQVSSQSMATRTFCRAQQISHFIHMMPYVCKVRCSKNVKFCISANSAFSTGRCNKFGIYSSPHSPQDIIPVAFFVQSLPFPSPVIPLLNPNNISNVLLYILCSVRLSFLKMHVYTSPKWPTYQLSFGDYVQCHAVFEFSTSGNPGTA